MARMVVCKGEGPLEIKVGGESRWICQCGLSTNPPFCTGTHKQAAGEEAGKLYQYENGKRKEVKG